MNLAYLFLVLLIPIFVTVWVSLSALFSVLSGWRKLSYYYPWQEPTRAISIGGASVSVGHGGLAVTYSGVYISVSPSGMTLSAKLLVRLFHPPFFIPWSEIVSCQREKQFLWQVTSFRLKTAKQVLKVSGKAGLKVYDYWQKEVLPRQA